MEQWFNCSAHRIWWSDLFSVTAEIQRHGCRSRNITESVTVTFGRNRKYAESVKIYYFGAETETETEIRSNFSGNIFAFFCIFLSEILVEVLCLNLWKIALMAYTCHITLTYPWRCSSRTYLQKHSRPVECVICCYASRRLDISTCQECRNQLANDVCILWAHSMEQSAICCVQW